MRCALCKGYRLLCGRNFCPILRKIRVVKGVFNELKLGREIFGSSPPSIFVGERGYPNVRVSPLIPPVEGDTSYLENPLSWEDVTLEEALKRRSMLVMGERFYNVRDRLDFEELVISSKPVDAEMVLNRRPTLKLDFEFSVVNPKAKLERLRVVDNPKVPKVVEKVLGDDLKAKDAMITLYENGINEYYVVRLLSAGLLGVERRLVPTRWSITATEDTIGNYLKKEVADFKPIEKFEIYHDEFMGNRYTILMTPSSFAFELLEVWLPNSIFGFSGVLRDYELSKKYGYADETHGAYYSARLSVLEFLRERRRRAKVIVFREITEDYFAPIGSWQVRVGVRKALKNKIGEFDDLRSALKVVRGLLKFRLEDYLRRDVLLKHKTLQDF